MAQGSVEGVQMVMATSLVIGCAAASSALWYFSRRYVGELSLLPETHQACFSVLDFWGNREVCSSQLAAGNSLQGHACVHVHEYIQSCWLV